MTTYLGDKAVGIGTVKAEIGVTGIVLHDETLVGNGNTEPLGVNTANIVSQQTLANTVSVLNTAIDAQADAIAKTRKDMNEKDSELESILNEHADELTTLRGNQASLGDQVSNIESKIPESASETNPLITKQQLLDEEMDIRDDYNELVSELQTQITAQAGAIASKQDKLTAGDGISIIDNVISATTAKSEWGKITGELSAQTDLQDALGAKQDKLTAGANIRIEDNVISSTAQESFFRGRYKNWDSVPTNGLSYPNDIDGNHIPSNTDYIIIEDSSTVPGGQVEVQMTMETDRYSVYPTNKLETVINGVTYNGAGTFDDGNIEVFCNTDAGNYTAHWKTLKNSVEYQGKTYEAGSVFFKVVIRPEKNTTQNAKLSLGNPYTGSWRFSYRGAWDLDNKNGWKAEYQIEEIMPIADETQMGIAKLYTATGSNEDGSMTQKAITENTTRVIIRRWN